MGILDFYRISPTSANKVAPDMIDKTYKRRRMQTFIAATLGYALYYVCRLSMGVMKQPIIDAGLLNATQLGIVGACLYWTYAVGVLISFLGGLMAVDLVPRKASGAALGIVGIASYAAAGLQNIVTGLLLDNNIVDGVHDFTYVSWFWLGAAVISFLLPVLNWRRKQQVI